MIWDQAAINELKRLWPDRLLSTAEIGRRLGCGKNAIAGKRFHLGLEPRPSPSIKGGRTALVAMRKDHPSGDTLPALASLSAPLPKPAVKLFQTVAAPILSIEDRDRRILLMANRTDGQCARLLGISRNVVRHVRAKDRRETAPEAAAPVAKSPCVAVVAPPEPRAAPVPSLPSSRAIPATYHHSAPSSCQWPTGERTSVYHTFRLCGCADVVPGKPYCAEHTKLAYVRVRYDAATL